MKNACLSSGNCGGALKIGLARIDITPDRPIRMAGYGARKASSDRVRDRLHAKALLIENPDASRALLITADLIGFRRTFADSLGEEIAAVLGMARSGILFNASHTHAGPVFGAPPHVTEGFSPDERRAVEDYTRTVREKLMQAALFAAGDLQPARLALGAGMSSLMVNRREFAAEGIRIGFNPQGYVDRRVPVLRVERPDGGLRAVLFQCSCHNTALMSDNLGISSDYAGDAQRYVEESTPGVMALFMQGLGGTSVPWPRGTYDLCLRHGQGLGMEACRVLSGAEFQPVLGPVRPALCEIDLPLTPRPTPDQLDALRSGDEPDKGLAAQLDRKIASGALWPTHLTTPVAFWRFGDTFDLIGLPGEVVAEFLPLIEHALGPRGLWLSAYCNDYFGYLPTAQLHDQGGYESRDFITPTGFLARTAESALIAGLRRIALHAGRPLPEWRRVFS